MGRTSNADERLLDAACGLIGERGYSAVGVADICALAGVPKGSFYYFFESKQALTLATINVHWAKQRLDWDAALAGKGRALARLRTLVLATTKAQRQAKDECGRVDGCLLGNLSLELSNKEESVRARLDEIFGEQIQIVHELLKAAAAEGNIEATAATAKTARAVVAHLEGMVLFAKLKDNARLLDDVWPHALLLIRAFPT